jgi:hypothetical protein
MMPSIPFRRPPKLIAVSSTLIAAACVSFAIGAGSVDVPSQRERLRMAAEPKGVQELLAVQKSMVTARGKPNEQATREVVVTGQIGGMPNIWPQEHPAFPWYEKQASFFLVDNKIAGQFASHAKHHGGNHNCAFCQSLAVKNAHAIAVVNFVDENGEIIRVDTRELLGLKENQKIVVRGKARLLGGAMLVIDADGVFTRR